jgi:hypothetical protein
MTLFFEYIGDVDEDNIDLINRHCFKKILIKCNVHNMYHQRGHYCVLCDRFLQLNTRLSLVRHIKSKKHCHHVFKDIDKSNVDIDKMKNIIWESLRYYFNNNEKEDVYKDIKFIDKSYNFKSI